MNYKTILMASAAVMFAGAANAADITSPMYLPEAGKLLSNTSLEYDRAATKHHAGTTEDLAVAEELTYGITNNFAVVGEIRNYFDIEGLTNRDYNNDHNFGYKIGAKYNFNSCSNWLAQAGLSYYTMDPESWWGHRGSDYGLGGRWSKNLEANFKLAYQLPNGALPYSSLTANSNIDDNDRTIEYSWFNGIHMMHNNMSADAGIRYDFNLDGTNTNQWYLQGGVNYFVKENITVGVYADYYLGGTSTDANGSEIDYNYTVGLNAKVLF